MKLMLKSFSALLLLAFVATSCGVGEDGQLVGSQDRPSWKGINPYGMVYIPSGQLHIGPSDQDVAMTLLNRPKTISIQGFFMDDTEVTNNEYRQFVDWVRDSMAHSLLDHFVEDEEGGQQIDWEMEIDWETDKETLAELFYQGNDKFAGKQELDTRKMEFEYQWYDWQAAAHNHDASSSRTSFIRKETVNIYPDTMVWIRDFSYSFNEPMTRNYFWHPAFDDYPVVGITWKQANAFCYWRTQLWNTYRGAGKGEVNSEDFRLPTEFEWEYAARAGHETAPYPWGGYYTRNSKGCLLANFKPGRGNYPEDGGQYTVKADAYYPNDFGLYNMGGNVSEWTSSAWDPNSTSFVHDLNPDNRFDAKDEDPEAYKLKVVRGGSWKDVAYYMQTGTQANEFQDTAKSYVGFRSALTFLGRSMNDF